MNNLLRKPSMHGCTHHVQHIFYQRSYMIQRLSSEIEPEMLGAAPGNAPGSPNLEIS